MSSNGGGGSNLLDMGLMVAAGVAAPELAPVLFEGGLAGSTALATAATGAALSGAAGAITGQNVARSAGIGALGGALSGALAPASGGIDSLGAVSDVAPVTEGAPIASETGDIATNTSGEMLTPQGAVINPQATPTTMGNTQDIADMSAGPSAGKVPTATGANANTYMPNAPSSNVAGNNFLGMGPATNLQMGVSGLTNLYGYQTPRPGAYTPAPYKGGNLSKFHYDPNNYQPDVVTPPNPVYHAQYAQGGITSLAIGGGISTLGSYSDGGRLLKGPGDGMSDSIPAKIGKKQEARLAEGEFVVPADVVSGLGNGSTDAGAKHLYKMMDKVRHARTGRKSQGKQITAEKYIPA